MINDAAKFLLNHLGRGGNWQYYWRDNNTPPVWFKTGQPSNLPKWTNIYFGVHPGIKKFTGLSRGKIDNVAAINCLFAEFDMKDGWVIEKINDLTPSPSVIISSGGGWHLYWLLSDTTAITDQNREQIRKIQDRWVRFMGGDPGAKDLARVLRVPGSTNHKYNPPRPVELIAQNALFYDLADLEMILPVDQTTTKPTQNSSNPKNLQNDGEYWLQKFLGDLRGHDRNRKGFDLACQLRDSRLSQTEAAIFMREWAHRVPVVPNDPYTESDAMASLAQAYNSPPRQPAVLPGSNNRRQNMNNQQVNQTTPPPQAATQPQTKQMKPTDDELACWWIAQTANTAFGLGDWRRYNGGIWEVVPEDNISAEVMAVLIQAKTMGIRPNRSTLNSVIEFSRLKIRICDDRWDSNPNVLICKNGVLDLVNLTLSSHSPSNYATFGLDYDYDPTATAPTWDHVLRTTVPGSAVFLQEFAGYCLTTSTKFETAIWLVGPAGSGKSTIVEGFQSFLGERCGQLGLADIERSRFALGNLQGKNLVVAAEQPAIYMQATHVLNQLISGEMIRIERKFKDAFEFRPSAKLLWAMNDMPRISDSNNGLFRRVKVIKFPSLAKDKRDPQIKEAVKLEGTGILNWAIQGLQRLNNRGYFNIPASVDTATNNYQMNNDIPALFVEECCEVGSTYKVQSQNLYNEYKTWCIDTGHKPQSSTSIANEWERLGFDKYMAAGKAFWRGVGLKTP